MSSKDLVRAPSLRESPEDRFWLELREPGCVPQRKGPWLWPRLAPTLREFMSARPRAFITVLSVSSHGGPDVQDGPEALMVADYRSRSTARKHMASSAAAFGEQSQGRLVTPNPTDPVQP